MNFRNTLSGLAKRKKKTGIALNDGKKKNFFGGGRMYNFKTLTLPIQKYGMFL